ncbi:MAG: hypothetical protein PHC44_00195 [Lutispora sp.]|nr:hypothetical protein [Lutispora sp.]
MLKRKKLLILAGIFILAAITIVSCTPSTKEPDAKIPPQKDDVSLYYPLKVGSEWEYEGEGNEYAAYTQKVIYSKDNKYQVMIDNGGTRAANIYEIKDDSIVNTYMEGEVYDEKNVLDNDANLDTVIIKLPIEVGNKWISEENSYEIIDINASVTVPAGTFEDCIIVKEIYKDKTAYRNYYYKKEVGLVKSEYKTNDGFTVSSLLKSYKLVSD